MSDPRPDRIKKLRALAIEKRKTAVRPFWDTPATIAAILRTTSARGAITMRQIKGIWAGRGRALAIRIVGHGEEDLLTTLAARDWSHHEPMLDEELVLTRRGRAVAADSPRYQAIGNSVVPAVIKWIGQRLALLT